MGEPRYEMVWDCPACETQGLLGVTHRHCPACGAAQDPSRRYFPPDDARVAVDDHPYQGVDVVCGACDTPNAAKAQFCVGCGSPLSGAAAAALRAEQVAGASGFADDSARAAKAEADARRDADRAARMAAAASAPPAAPASGGWGWALPIAGGGALIAVCCGVVGAFLFWKQDASIEVTGHEWSRTIEVEALQSVVDEAWRDELPADAQDVRCRDERRGSTRVPDGQDCRDVRVDLGDGSFTTRQDCTAKFREEPRFDARCRYTVKRWKTVDTARAGGAALVPAPEWPAVSLATGRREGARSERYVLRVRGASGDDTCEVDQARWAAATVGSRWAVEVGVLTGALDCSAVGR